MTTSGNDSNFLSRTAAESAYGAYGREGAPQDHEPIAIVGMACRFPGADDLDAFWQLLEEGGNSVTEGVPGSGVGRIGELFQDAAVQSDACRFAAFIDDVDKFDAPFFRISSVEAQHLDPQQRLMLETSWHALEDAGIDPERLKGTLTGVYGGVSNNEYRGIIMEASDTAEPASSLYTVSGTSYNTAVGRVAFALGLRGPAIALDTACSSSLVAIHQAVTGLQRGEANLALAGGVHTILSGRLLELRANAGMLAPDGRCKTFDAAANGYVRGEGCGIIALKRLSDAEANGDRIWGVIRGSALNQDGASTGLTVPSREAQEQVIEAALLNASVQPAQVDYVEAHGTGTPVGDPIELEAVAAAYRKDRPADRPLLIGSVKTNFGHLESAAGVAGVMKVLLAMNKGVIPRHLNFRNPTPAVDWQKLPLQVTATATEWPQVDYRAPLAGISGFGWSGTNAHVVIEGYRPPQIVPGALPEEKWPNGSLKRIAVSLPETVSDSTVEAPAARDKRLLPLSGKTDTALRELAERYLAWLDGHSKELASDSSADSPLLSDMAFTAGVGRGQFAHRAGVAFKDAESLRAGLKAIVEDSGVATDAASKVAFVYTGQGSQWFGMGKTLYDREPVFRAILDRCEQVILEERGVSLLDVMFGVEGAQGDLYDTAWTQPAVYALECALTALWRSIGVEPSVVIGHSLGEFAAAQAAGVFGLEDGLRFVAKRGALLSSVPELGTMAAIFAPEDEVKAAVERNNANSGKPELSVAVDNGIHQVISGPVDAVETVCELFEAGDITVRRLRNQAFHSALVEPALDELEEAYRNVEPSPPSISLVSNVTGSPVASGETLDGKYWRDHARQAVQFRKGIGAMAELGVDLVIEVGPHAVLGPLVSLVWPDSVNGAATTKRPDVLESMLRLSWDIDPADYDDGFMDAVAGAYNAGLALSFEGLFAGEERQRVSLPSYPFRRERHWIDPPRRRRAVDGHSLIGTRHESPHGDVSFVTDIYPSDPVWLNDHRVFGRLIAPGALFGAMASSAALAEGRAPIVVEDFQLHNPLVFPENSSEYAEGEEGRQVQVLLDDSGQVSSNNVQIFSRGAEDEWILHIEARLSSTTPVTDADGRIDLESLKSRLSPLDVPQYYREKADAGIDLGPFFRTLENLWSAPGEALGEVILPESVGRNDLDVHPLLMDGCFQVIGVARNMTGAAGETTYLPFGWERFWLTRQLPDKLFCHVIMDEPPTQAASESADQPEVLSGEMRIYDPSGVLIGGFSGYTVKRATRAALLSAFEGVSDLLYEIDWRNRPLESGLMHADFFPNPATVHEASGLFSEYLADVGVDPQSRNELLADLERWSHSYALRTLENLGWQRKTGEILRHDELRERLKVNPEHSRLFLRMLEMLAQAGVLEQRDDDFVVLLGERERLPVELPDNPEEFDKYMVKKYPHGLTEIGLFKRLAAALADVLRGQADPLTLLFSSGEPTAADIYLNAPGARAANQMLADAIRTLLRHLPEDRRLRIIEIGAGTGAATASVLPELPEGRFHYTYTDISAGFFAEAESRFGDDCIEYRTLDIEKDPVAQGFDAHGYDIVLASNVLHATRYLQETLGHCRDLLSPSGQLVALENLRGRGWADLIFGQLDGWWRFADDYRPNHAIVPPAIWRQVLADVGFVGSRGSWRR